MSSGRFAQPTSRGFHKPSQIDGQTEQTVENPYECNTQKEFERARDLRPRDTEAVRASRKLTLELLLSNHAVDCHHCLRIGSTRCDDLDPKFCEWCFFCDCVKDGFALCGMFFCLCAKSLHELDNLKLFDPPI